VIRFIDKPKRLSLLEYLYFAGDDRLCPRRINIPNRVPAAASRAVAGARRSDEIQELIRKVQNNEAVPQAQERLISPAQRWVARDPKRCHIAGSSGHQFADGDPADTPLIEHASMTLAPGFDPGC